MIPPEEHVQVYINGGHMEYTMKSTLKNFAIHIYVNNNSMKNILYLKEVVNYFRVTMDTNEYHTMLIHLN